MIHPYSELYIDEFQDNLGEMTEYLALEMRLPMTEIQDRFLASRAPRQIELGNPDYLVGKGGLGLARAVMEQTGYAMPSSPLSYNLLNPGAEYWTGWALAYLQWFTGMSFSSLAKYGYGFVNVLDWYNPYHEADISKFVDDAVAAIRKRMDAADAPLKQLRKRAGFTQQQLAELSGVNLRMIRAYEQKAQDISRAEAGSVLALSKVLNCEPSDLTTSL